jgi:hypothetical protein
MRRGLTPTDSLAAVRGWHVWAAAAYSAPLAGGGRGQDSPSKSRYMNLVDLGRLQGERRREERPGARRLNQGEVRKLYVCNLLRDVHTVAAHPACHTAASRPINTSTSVLASHLCSRKACDAAGSNWSGGVMPSRPCSARRMPPPPAGCRSRVGGVSPADSAPPWSKEQA